MIDDGGGRRVLRGVAIGVVAAVSLGVVAGCSEAKPAAELPPVSTPEATAEEFPPLGPEDFPMPAEARQKTEAGILAFATYYFDLSNHLLPTLDSQPLRALSRGCDVCDQFTDGYDSSKAAGNSFEGGLISVRSGSSVVRGETGEIAFVLDQAAVTVRDPFGLVLDDQSTPAYSLSGGMSLAWDEDRSTWVVTSMTAERI